MSVPALITAGNGLSPAQKAWETRRARAVGGIVIIGRKPGPLDPCADALAAFERAAASDMPDWHGAALALKAALTGKGVRSMRIPRAKATPAIADDWADYPITGNARALANNLQWPSPVLIVTFADGEIVRAPALSLRGKPVNIGRGLRIAIAFYTARRARKSGTPNLPGCRAAVPQIVDCRGVFTDTGEDRPGAIYSYAQCSQRTEEHRRADDWRLRRG